MLSLRPAILAAADNPRVESVVTHAPLSRGVVRRFVPGAELDDAVRASDELVGRGLAVSLDHLGEDTTDPGMADDAVRAYLALLDCLADKGLTADGQVEVSVKLSAVGQTISDELAESNARRVCAAAREAGTTVTIDMEDHTTTDRTLASVHRLREDFPTTGAVVQSYLRRTEDDCRALIAAGSRVRLCKGAYNEPESVAFQQRAEVDASYVRCLEVLMAGEGYPMVATHDPALITRAGELGTPGQFEFQMLYGIRPLEQERLAEQGHTVRVYTPYGQQWYGYLMRRLAERPANVWFFLRALATRS